MDCLTLIELARQAGVVLIPEGGQLRIRGPKAAEALVQQLLEQKDSVLEHLRFRAPSGVSVTETPKNCVKGEVSETGTVVFDPDHPIAGFDWDSAGICPTPVIVRDGVRHKHEACAGRESWRHVWGERFCLRCWPPTDSAAVVPVEGHSHG